MSSIHLQRPNPLQKLIMKRSCPHTPQTTRKISFLYHDAYEVIHAARHGNGCEKQTHKQRARRVVHDSSVGRIHIKRNEEIKNLCMRSSVFPFPRPATVDRIMVRLCSVFLVATSFAVTSAAPHFEQQPFLETDCTRCCSNVS